jgi:hypothetical protein
VFFKMHKRVRLMEQSKDIVSAPTQSWHVKMLYQYATSIGTIKNNLCSVQ